MTKPLIQSSTLQRWSKFSRPILLLLPVLIIIGLAGPAALAQPNEKLPKGDDLVDAYIKATGGKAAYEKLNSRVTKGTFEIPAQGIKFVITTYGAKPDKFYSVMESDMLGKKERGVSGDLVWEMNVMQGPQVKEGSEKILMQRGAVFNADLKWRKMYKKAECVGTETIDEKTCYKVVMTPTEGEPETRYYDQKTNLLVKTEMIVKIEMGDIPIESYPQDYKEVDGIKIPHQARIVAMGMDRIMTTTSIEHNVKLPKDRFDPPEEIKALAQQQKEKEKEKESKPETP